jgi:hypothetical protein
MGVCDDEVIYLPYHCLISMYEDTYRSQSSELTLYRNEIFVNFVSFTIEI